MISTGGLTKRFGPCLALRGIDLTVGRGESVLILGADGAGKTTLMRILATLSRPTEGQVTVGGYDVVENPVAVRRLTGFVSHQPLLYDELTAEENLRFYARLYGVAGAGGEISATLSWMGLTAQRNSKVGTFSRGMRQRLAIARALIHDPLLLLMDEPYAGLDDEAAASLQKIVAVLRRRNRTVVVTASDPEDGVALADRVVFLIEGKLSDDVSISDWRTAAARERGEKATAGK